VVAGQDLIAATSVGAGYPERPRAIGVDAVLQAVQVEAVAVLVPVAHVDGQLVADIGVEDTPGHPMVPGRFVDVGRHQLAGHRVGITGVVIAAVDNSIKSGGEDLLRSHTPDLMAGISHAIAAVMAGTAHRRERAIARHGLDLEIDIAMGHQPAFPEWLEMIGLRRVPGHAWSFDPVRFIPTRQEELDVNIRRYTAKSCDTVRPA